MDVTTVGLDLAKMVVQVHALDAEGHVVVRQRLRRSEVITFFKSLPPCLIAMEACSSAHYWARELIALGHDVRLMPPIYVKPYVKRGKNDAADAEAIAEAVTRPTMRFVPVKTVEQQAGLALHRTRDLLVRQRTMLANALRSQCAELGIVVAQGMAKVDDLIARIMNPAEHRIPPIARECLLVLTRHLHDLRQRIGEVERAIHAWHRSNEVSRRLETIPGVGPITASALAAAVTDPHLFRSGRHLAAWLGLVPRQNSSGGKERLGRISKQGDSYIRRLLISGAITVLRHARTSRSGSASWAATPLERRPAKVVAVALANKAARITWAMLARGEVYRTAPQPQIAESDQARSAQEWVGGAREVMTNGRTGVGQIR